MKKEQDLRYIRTRQMIKAALFELIDSVGFDKITIQNLSDKAMINRSTFYLHYTDKYDLLDKIEDEMLEEMKNIITAMPLEPFDKNPVDLDKGYEIITHMYAYILKNRSFFEYSFYHRGTFTRKFSGIIKEMLRDKIRLHEVLNVPEDYLISFASGAHIGLMTEWLMQKTPESPEEMAEIIIKMAKGIAKGFIRS